ncbi:ATP-binding protein [Silvibacterium sp.]|uniref:hybrid sensor histidine kinase/response regulator n=1 Tax=Silvibacterium sp. TaxID=1964179 RepID=UPI0039E71693
MPTSQQLNGTPLRVLLVEDNADDAFILERHLRRAGYSVFVRRVETGEDMREALSAESAWNVILADYHLPTFSAPAALTLLKSTGHDIPFIMMSGAVDEETAVSAMRAGAHDYIAKQNLARLVPAIEREVKEAEARRARRQTESALRSMEERFHRLVEAMPLALLISDIDGRITYANQGIENLLGYSQAEIASGAVTLSRIFGTSGIGLPCAVGPSKTSEPAEVECINASGARVPVLVGSAELNPGSQDSAPQIAAFLVDLTEQRRSQEVLRRTEKLAAAGRLAASIAHEINNPLEAVTNCLYLLGQMQFDEQARTFLDLAQRELNRVVHITTQTLRFYRQSTKPIETDLHELLETVVALYEGRLRSQCIQIEREYGQLPPVVVHDGEIRQVMANLLGNAIDAMASSGGRLVLRTAVSRDWATGREGFSFTIADTGTGIDAATRAHLFEPFYSTKGITGTGLGLWVSRGIVEKHGGRISLRSHAAQNGGTVFRIFLPFAAPPVEIASTPLLQVTA